MSEKEELIRYSRHLNLPGFTTSTQETLSQARVLVVGAGGLGSPVLLYLAAAGVGHLGIIDMDHIELSNLQRQVIYKTKDIGSLKVKKAKKVLNELNPQCQVRIYAESLSTQNALNIISDYDIVADGTDNFPTRYLVNDACVIKGKINVYASIFRFEGQVSVFNFPYPNGEWGPNYRDLYPSPPPPGLVPDCATGGVLGILPGVVGSLQATEVIKLITGIGNPLVGKLLLYDALEAETRIIRFANKTTTNISKLINYEQFCGVSLNKEPPMSQIKEITVQELKEWKDNNHSFQLVDVREQHEWDFVNIQGELIPLGDLLANSDKINTDKDVVLLCRTGQRSAAAVNALQQQGFENLYNLKGGIVAWAKEIDQSLPTY